MLLQQIGLLGRHCIYSPPSAYGCMRCFSVFFSLLFVPVLSLASSSSFSRYSFGKPFFPSFFHVCSESDIKVSVRLAFPLFDVPPTKKPKLPPFTRMVVVTRYEDDALLQQINGAIEEVRSPRFPAAAHPSASCDCPSTACTPLPCLPPGF